MIRTIYDNNVKLIKEREKIITRCQKRFKIKSTNRRNRGKIDTPNTHIHNRSLFRLFLIL